MHGQFETEEDISVADFHTTDTFDVRPPYFGLEFQFSHVEVLALN